MDFSETTRYISSGLKDFCKYFIYIAAQISLFELIHFKYHIKFVDLVKSLKEDYYYEYSVE